MGEAAACAAEGAGATGGGGGRLGRWWCVVRGVRGSEVGGKGEG